MPAFETAPLPGQDRFADGSQDLVGNRDAVLEVEREWEHGCGMVRDLDRVANSSVSGVTLIL